MKVKVIKLKDGDLFYWVPVAEEQGERFGTLYCGRHRQRTQEGVPLPGGYAEGLEETEVFVEEVDCPDDRCWEKADALMLLFVGRYLDELEEAQG